MLHPNMRQLTSTQSGRERLLDAAVHTIRAKGYSGTTVDDICRAAGVTKGGFFHHFASKEELGVEAARHFSAMADSLFGQAAYHGFADPLDRVFGYVDLRRAIVQGQLPEYTCLLGTMVQETYVTHPAIRAVCEEHIWGNAAMVEGDIAEAIERHGIGGEWTAEGLALHTQAVLQGAFILAKAKGGGEAGRRVAADSVDHLRRYLELLFNRAAAQKAGE
jgi:TetR/AcrR family transcriptional repressor of nem operon